MSLINTHRSARPRYNPADIRRKSKGLHKLGLGGIATPFFYTTDVVVEATAMKITGTAPGRVSKAAPGEEDKIIGLAMQDTYELPTGQFSQLAGYRFGNDTAEIAGHRPIGIFQGTGYAQITNYVGRVSWGQQAFLTADGLLTGTAPTPESVGLPVWFQPDRDRTETDPELNSVGEDPDDPNANLPGVVIAFQFPIFVNPS